MTVSFQRLLFSCTFPDGCSAIGSLVSVTNDIEIAKLDKKTITPMSNELLAQF